MAEGVADGRNDVIRFLDVENEAQLVPKHDEMHAEHGTLHCHRDEYIGSMCCWADSGAIL